MAASYSDWDLDLIPNLTFSTVKDYIKNKKASSGENHMSKGYKYFSKGYVEDLKRKICFI